MKELTKEQIDLIKKPLPIEAVKKHPTKTYLSTIKAIYVTERLNDVFGIGSWQIKTDPVSVQDNGMVVCKTILSIPDYGIYYESFGGSDNGGENSKNFDLGDAYKGATTDAITKICSYIGIGIDVFKGQHDKVVAEQNAKQEPAKAPAMRDWSASINSAQSKDEAGNIWVSMNADEKQHFFSLFTSKMNEFGYIWDQKAKKFVPQNQSA